MEQTRIQAFGDELYQAMLNREAVAPLTDRGEDITINDAYHISLRMLERRLADGASVIGKKIGVTSKASKAQTHVSSASEWASARPSTPFPCSLPEPIFTPRSRLMSLCTGVIYIKGEQVDTLERARCPTMRKAPSPMR